MNTFIGNIIEGEYDSQDSEFTLKQVKNLETKSVVSSNHIKALLSYLEHQIQQKEECVLTLNDQIPVRLSQQEMELLIEDFKKIQGKM